MQTARHILVIRFSAMGDVAMTVPVLKAALDQYPNLNITVVSNAFLQPLFAGLDRCHFYPAELKSRHKGVAGLFRLYRELTAQYKFDAVADLHGVLRSAILRSFFKMSGYATAVIDKGRAAKKALVRKDHKILQQLPSSFERYAAVLKALQLPVALNPASQVYARQQPAASVASLLSTSKKNIGIAPFAQHAEKMYPLEQMKTLVQLLSAKHNLILLGGGSTEKNVLAQWVDEIPGIHTLAGKVSFGEELTLISNLDAMISMDSANMHLAALYKVPVISIWGATHPYAGFYGWAQDPANIVSVDLSCRPCSVFGNKPCWRGDHACMRQITNLQVAQKLDQLFLK